jgi:hypothetical protein
MHSLINSNVNPNHTPILQIRSNANFKPVPIPYPFNAEEVLHYNDVGTLTVICLHPGNGKSWDIDDRELYWGPRRKLLLGHYRLPLFGRRGSSTGEGKGREELGPPLFLASLRR